MAEATDYGATSKYGIKTAENCTTVGEVRKSAGNLMSSLKQEWEKRQEAKLVRKAQRGDVAAFTKLIERYQRPIYASIFGMVLSHEQTDDLIQETFIKAHRNLYRFDLRLPFYPWIRRIAINTTINWLKSEKAKKTYSLDALEDTHPMLVLDENPGHIVERKEMRSIVSKALLTLPIEQRTVFVYRVLQEMSYEEIAGELQISIGTVMSRLNRARNKLRKHLKGYLPINHR